MKRVSGRFIADGNAINVDIGFEPDYVKLIEGLEDTNPNIYEYFADLENAGADGQYGVLLTGSTGVVTVLAGTDAKVATYSGSKKAKVRIPAPDGDGYENANVADYSTSTDYSSAGQARTTSQVGTVVRPTTHNGYVYECTVAGGVGSTEPTWPTTVGETVTDSDSNNTWICRREDVVFDKGGGFTVGSDLSTDDDEWIYVAEQHDRVVNHGDAAAADPI